MIVDKTRNGVSIHYDSDIADIYDMKYRGLSYTVVLSQMSALYTNMFTNSVQKISIKDGLMYMNGRKMNKEFQIAYQMYTDEILERELLSEEV